MPDSNLKPDDVTALLEIEALKRRSELSSSLMVLMGEHDEIANIIKVLINELDTKTMSLNDGEVLNSDRAIVIEEIGQILELLRADYSSYEVARTELDSACKKFLANEASLPQEKPLS